MSTTIDSSYLEQISYKKLSKFQGQFKKYHPNVGDWVKSIVTDLASPTAGLVIDVFIRRHVLGKNDPRTTPTNQHWADMTVAFYNHNDDSIYCYLCDSEYFQQVIDLPLT